jgi:hypothetical protein
MAVVRTIPQVTLAAGLHVFGPDTIPADRSQFLFTFNQVSWPYTGGLAITFTCDVSLDGGVTWVNPPQTETVNDDPIPARRGFPANQFRFAFTLPGVGISGRQIRLSALFEKSLTLSGSVSAN